jgi:hypothetical protein
MQDDAIHEIVAILWAQHEAWSRAGVGLLPTPLLCLRLRSSIGSCPLRIRFAITLCRFQERAPTPAKFWVTTTLRSLCEGAIQLFLTVYYNDYIADEKAMRRKGEIVDPKDAQLIDLINFYLRHGDSKFESFLDRVRTRGNGIHHFRDRVIGTQDELKADIVHLRDFLASIDSQLPDPPPLPDPDW